MNTVVVGFDYNFIRNSIIKLEEDKVINICSWFICGKTFDQEGCKLKNSIFWRNILQRNDCSCEYKYDIPDDVYDYLYMRFAIYLDHLTRESYYENRTIPENKNVINILMHYMYDLLHGDNIEMVVFADAPHGAYACILYDMAKILRIKTLIIRTHYAQDKLLYCWDLENTGFFKKKVEVNQHVVDNDDLFGHYEKKVYWPKEKNNNIIAIVKRIVESKKESYHDYKMKYDNIYDYISRHIIRTAQRSYRKYLYNYYSQKLFINEIKEKEKYVYFPLHLQPEMTTSTLGKEYNDQILAVERVARIIPEDWYIYVKENPLQTYAYRDKYFYKRLQGIKKVKLIKSNTNTYDLIRNSEFVATITGTAGFEAISGGKPVLVFGLAWYRSLPGVTIYNSDTALKDIFTEFTVEDVKKEYERLNHNMIEGVVAEECLQYVEIDYDKNCGVVYNFLKEIIKNEAKNV